MKNYFFVIAGIILFLGCETDTTDGNNVKNDFSDDYFPFTRTYTWTYSTNAFSDSGESVSTFEMRIDTATFRNGVFWALMGRLPGTTQWGHIFALKDSAGIVYTIGDNPPETPFPLFKHQYLASEGTRETISVSGTTYETVRIDFAIENGMLSLWFAKGIGLVKESSDQGYSLFIDDHTGDSVSIQTTLVSLQK